MKKNMKYLVVFLVCMQQSTCSQQQEKQLKPLTPTQNILVGALTGMGEVATTGQLCTYLKNKAQAGKANTSQQMLENASFAAKAKQEAQLAARGLSINLIAMVPTTAVQNGVYNAVLKNEDQEAMTDVTRIKAAAVAGFASASISGPAELGIIQKMQFNRSMPQVYRQYGFTSFGRGLFGTGVRDLGFTVAYKGALKPTKSLLTSAGVSENIAEATSPGLVGVTTAVVTHPIDTTITMQKLDLAKAKYKNFGQTAITIYKEEGMRGLYKGVGPRGTRVIAAVYSMPWVEDRLVKIVKRLNERQGR